MNKVRIQNIAKIQGGCYMRTGSGGDITLLNANYFNDFGILKKKVQPTISYNECPEQHLLKNNDILVVTKGGRFTASLYDESFGPCIASTAFVVIRLDTNKLLPQYVTVYMNEALQSTYFKNRTRGTSIPSLPRSALAEYNIPIPALSYQQTIIDAYSEFIKQNHIYEELRQKKQKRIHSLILSTS